MFNLNHEITQWRADFEARGILNADELDELQSHLIEVYKARLAGGISEPQAFSQAIERVGDPAILSIEYEKTHPSPTKKLWRAFWVAPLVAPLLLAVDVFTIGLLLSDPKDPGTPIGIILLPALILTIGVVASYFITAIFWMPIVIFLHRRKRLDGGSIHLMAFLLAVLLFAVIEAAIYFITTPRPNSIAEFIGSSLYIPGFVIPHIMVSALVFWLMVRDRTIADEWSETSPHDS